MKTLAAFAVVFLLLWGGYYYLSLERQAAFKQGYQAAVLAGKTQLEALQKSHALALVEQSQAAYQQVQQAIKNSQNLERSHLNKQRRLNTEINALRERLDDAIASQPVCYFADKWVQHYTQALGLPTHSTPANSAAGANASPAAAASSTDILKHAQSYGHWCRTNTQQLIDLQALLREREN